jgi:mannosyltransferase OCH1-like enzyme
MYSNWQICYHANNVVALYTVLVSDMIKHSKKASAFAEGIWMSNLAPVEISENHQLRSQYMWGLIRNPGIYTSPNEQIKIPRTLIQFWDDVVNMPADVRKCIDSWKSLDECDFKRLLFSDEDARLFIMRNYDQRHIDAFERCQHPAMRSDYFRLCYILKAGGLYVDADDVFYNVDIETLFQDNKLKVQPLCYDLSTDLMVNAIDFLTSNEYSQDLIYYVNNNPIIAPPNHPVIKLALERSTQILLAPGSKIKDVQSTTGPGNLTASLIRYAIESQNAGQACDFVLIDNWDSISISQWPLEYRKDKRNWRLWDGNDY